MSLIIYKDGHLYADRQTTYNISTPNGLGKCAQCGSEDFTAEDYNPIHVRFSSGSQYMDSPVVAIAVVGAENVANILGEIVKANGNIQFMLNAFRSVYPTPAKGKDEIWAQFMIVTENMIWLNEIINYDVQGLGYWPRRDTPVPTIVAGRNIKLVEFALQQGYSPELALRFAAAHDNSVGLSIQKVDLERPFVDHSSFGSLNGKDISRTLLKKKFQLTIDESAPITNSSEDTKK